MHKCVIVFVPYAFIALFQSYKFGATLSHNGLERVSLEWSEIEFQKTISIECHEIQVDKFFCEKMSKMFFFLQLQQQKNSSIFFVSIDGWAASSVTAFVVFNKVPLVMPSAFFD